MTADEAERKYGGGSHSGSSRSLRELQVRCGVLAVCLVWFCSVCFVLQCTLRQSQLQSAWPPRFEDAGVFQSVAVCCSVTAVYCSVTAVCWPPRFEDADVLQCVVECYSVVQFDAMCCCSVTAVCCSVLQCVMCNAACRSGSYVLQRVADDCAQPRRIAAALRRVARTFTNVCTCMHEFLICIYT